MTRSYEVTGDLSELIDRANALADHELAAAVKDWRGRTRLSEAALLLGIPPTTLEKIEQGRGFRYPRLLLTAMRDLKPHGRWR
jgi:hypothetical protein